MNILVTGSYGFIGSHVSTYLKENGHYVIGLGRKKLPTSEVDEYICCDIHSEEVENILEQ